MEKWGDRMDKEEGAGKVKEKKKLDKQEISENKKVMNGPGKVATSSRINSHNRFHRLEDVEEVATSHSATYEAEVSNSKPSTSEPTLAQIRRANSKAKASGLFPTGSLNTNKKGSSKTKATGLFPIGTLNTKVKGMPKSFSDPIKFQQLTLQSLAP